jgi:DNA-binding Xre family transcriptional regulator
MDAEASFSGDLRSDGTGDEESDEEFLARFPWLLEYPKPRTRPRDLRDGAGFECPLERANEMTLAEVRTTCTALSQKEMAERLGLSQAAVSCFERREDVRVSKLLQYVDALEAKLQLVVKFDDGRAMVLTQFDGAIDPDKLDL